MLLENLQNIFEIISLRKQPSAAIKTIKKIVVHPSVGFV